MIRYFIFSLFTTALSLNLVAQSADILPPAEVEREIVVHHNSFSVSFNTSYILSHWVAYKITGSKVNEEAKVSPKYIQDPQIPGRSASKKDYKDSGYEMAQLLNFLDFSEDETTVTESFYMSNIVPMKPAFYKYVWLKIENLTRTWCSESDGLYIVCGPILKESPFQTIGESKVSVPKRFYKAIYDAKNQKAIGFIVKNGTTSPNLESYTVSIDYIEEQTGLNLFPGLEDELENKIEKELNRNLWKFE